MNCIGRKLRGPIFPRCSQFGNLIARSRSDASGVRVGRFLEHGFPFSEAKEEEYRSDDEQGTHETNNDPGYRTAG